jgi:hypothetical protein
VSGAVLSFNALETDDKFETSCTLLPCAPKIDYKNRNVHFQCSHCNSHRLLIIEACEDLKTMLLHRNTRECKQQASENVRACYEGKQQIALLCSGTCTGTVPVCDMSLGSVHLPHNS